MVCALAAALGAQAATRGSVLRFTAVQQSQKQTKNRFVIDDVDVANGKKVGRDRLTCTAISQTKATCSIVIFRSEGNLNAKFVLPFAASSGTGRITGGTGRYAGAKGSFRYRNLNEDGTRTSVVVTLT